VAQRVYADGEPAAILAANTGDDPDRLTDIAVDLLSMEIGRLRARQEGRRELTQHVLEDIIAGRSWGPGNDAQMRQLGFDPTRRFRVLLGQAGGSPHRAPTTPWSLQSLMSGQGEPFVRCTLDNRLVVLVPDDPIVDLLASTMLQHLSDRAPESSVGVSSGHVGADGIRIGYFEALDAVSAGPGIQRSAVVDLGRLLTLTSTQVPVREIAQAMLEPLLSYDARHGSELVQTLRVYLASDRNVGSSAEQLFVHRNTLRYRLRQVEELLGPDIWTTRRVTNLWLALEALETLGREPTAT
jgi:purine catabolism regulator